MRFRSTFVAGFVAVPLALAGCSQGGSDPQAQEPAQPAPDAPAEQPGPAPSGPADPVGWTDQLCGHVSGFAASQQQAPQVDKSNPQAFKDSSVAQMTTAEKAANDTLNGLKAMPPTSVQGADKVNSTFQDGFTKVADVLGSAKGKAQQVDPSNEQAFTQGMVGVQEELQKGQGINFDAQYAEFDKNPELRDAAMQAPSCQALMAPPQQQQQPQQQPPQ